MRRDSGTGSVYFDHKTGTGCKDSRYHKGCSGRWSASISLGRDGTGKRKRARLTARTKTELLGRLDEARRAAENGLDVSTRYTVGQCLDDFLAVGLDGAAPRTVAIQASNVDLLRPLLGAYRLRELTAAQVRAALAAIAENHATRSVAMCRSTLGRAIRLAQAEDRVSRNVADVVKIPAGCKPGRRRQAFSLEDMFTVLRAAESYRNMDAYIHLGFLVGASPDELLGLHWAQVDLDSDEPHIDITRTMRHHGGTKTASRRRGLGLPQAAVDALKRHRSVQAAERLRAGSAWEDNDLVFCTQFGRPLNHGNVSRAFKAICKTAQIPNARQRVPYEMRHTYASIIHDSGVPAEEVAKLLGHSRTQTFELVYRHVLRPQLRAGQRIMDTIVTQVRQAG